jgi:hypothetical protein
VDVDRGSFAEIPDGAAIRLPWGRDFVQRLAESLLQLAEDHELRHRIGVNASRFTAVNNSIDATVHGYRMAIELAMEQADHSWSSKATREFLSPQALSRVIERATISSGFLPLPLWFTDGVIPIYSQGVRAMWIGETPEVSLLNDFGYSSPHFKVYVSLQQAALAALARRSIDWIMLRISGPAGNFPQLEGYFAELNRLLPFGGLLILYSILDQSDDQISLTRSGLSRTAANYGFCVEAYVTGAVARTFDPPAASDGMPAQEKRCWRLMKVSETFGSESILDHVESVRVWEG